MENHIKVEIYFALVISGSGLAVPAAAEDLPEQATFRRGDANEDDEIDLSDSIYLLSNLFLGGKPPNCPDATDANDDGEVDISDPIFILSWLFLGSEEPPAPGPFKCGLDPTEDPLPPCASSVCSSETVDFPGTIILGSPTDTSVTASLSSNTDLEGYIEFGSGSGSYTTKTAAVAFGMKTPLAIPIQGLQPGARHFYRIRYRTPGVGDYAAGQERSFHTRRAPGSGFTFTVQADPHFNDQGFVGDLFRTSLENTAADAPDFHLDLGDTFLAEKLCAAEEEVPAVHAALRPYFAIVAGSAPLFLVNGNHDGESGWLKDGTPDSFAVACVEARHLHYPCPIAGSFYSGSLVSEPITGIRDSYYSWTWGDALFIVLDPYWYTAPKPNEKTGNWGWTLGREQYEWLRATLEGSQAHFTFVFIHHLVGGLAKEGRGGIEAAPFYEWGGANDDGSEGFSIHRPGWASPIHRLLVDHHVSIVFHGHDHVFVKQDLDGIVYQECPRPSFNQADAIRDATAFGYEEGDILPSPGHLRVDVSAERVKVQYVRAALPGKGGNGSVAYSYTVSPR